MEYRWIPGYEGVYDLDKEGNIRRHYKNTTIRNIKKYRQKDGQIVVNLFKDKILKVMTIKKAMYLTFPDIVGKPVNDTDVLVFKNGFSYDHRAENICFKTRAEIYRKNGDRKTVIKFDKNGNLIDSYKSIKSACKKNNTYFQRMSELLKSNGKMTDTQGNRYYYEDLYYDRRSPYGKKRTRVTE